MRVRSASRGGREVFGNLAAATASKEIGRRSLACAVERHWFSVGVIPTRFLSLRPVALEAAEGGNDFD